MSSALATFLQNELLTLSNEAKRKNPEIKEAAERLIFVIRTIKEKTASTQVAVGSPTIPQQDPFAAELSKSDDALRPFIMSCDTKNTKLVTIAIGCLQKLISHKAIPESSIPVVLKTLGENLKEGMDLQLKILQTILPLLTNYDGIHGDTLAEALLLCFRLQESKAAIVNNTAAATLRQLVIYLFDKVTVEDAKLKALNASSSEEHQDLEIAPPAVPPTAAGGSGVTQNNGVMLETTLTFESRPCAKDAYLLFQELCYLTNGDSSTFLKLSSLPKSFGLELIESILSNHHALFKRHPEFIALLRERVCPVVIKTLSDKTEFAQSVRLLRVVGIVVKQFHDILTMECEIFMSMFTKLLEIDHPPLWLRVLIMELYKSMCSDVNLLRSIFRNYDREDHATNVFQDMINSFGKIITTEKPGLLKDGSNNGKENSTPSNTRGGKDDGNDSSSNRVVIGEGMKVNCIDQLDKIDAPPLSDTYIIYLAIMCVLNVAESISFGASATTPTTASSSGSSDTASPEAELAEICKTVWPNLLASFSFLLTSSIEDELFTMVLKSFQSFTISLGLRSSSASSCTQATRTALQVARDAYLVCLCRVSVPSGSLSNSAILFEQSATNAPKMPSGSTAASTAGGSSFSVPNAYALNMFLNERNLCSIKSLLEVIASLQTTLDYRAWYLILETIQVADSLITLGKVVGGGSGSGNNANNAGKTGTSGGATTSLSASEKSDSLGRHGHGRDRNLSTIDKPASSLFVDVQYTRLVGKIRDLFEVTAKSMKSKALNEFLKALCRLSMENIDGGYLWRVIGKDAAKVAEEKSFATAKLGEVVVGNAKRLIVSPPLEGSEPTSASFMQSSTPEIWTLICNTLIDGAHHVNTTNGIRLQVCEVFCDVMGAASQVQDSTVEMRVLEPLKRFMYLTPDLPGPAEDDNSLKDQKRAPWAVEVQKWGLETLNKVLQSSGQNLSKGWTVVFEITKSVVVKPSSNSGSNHGLNVPSGTAAGTKSGHRKVTSVDMTAVELYSQSEEETSGPGPVSAGAADNKNAPAPTKGLVRYAFSCIQLICTDFLSLLTADCLTLCVDTLSCFGVQAEDLNIALTAIGLLWTVGDYVVTKRRELENIAASSPSAATVAVAGPTTTEVADRLWMMILTSLSSLCSDARPEVRNSANQTLFRTIATNGSWLTLPVWEECIWNVLYPLLEQIKVTSAQVEAMERGGLLSPSESPSVARKAPQLMVHHSRNTASKQWDETKMITLNGVTRTIRDNLSTLVELPDDRFQKAWVKYLAFLKDYFFTSSQEVTMGVVKNLKSLVRYFKEEPNPPENVSARAVPLWKALWEIWESIGASLVNNADEVGSDTSKVLFGSISTEVLSIYVSLFPDIYDVIGSLFLLPELGRLLRVLRGVVVYHTYIPPGADKYARLGANIDDKENLSNTQTTISNILLSKIDYDRVAGMEVLALKEIAGMFELPFIARDASVAIKGKPETEGGEAASPTSSMGNVLTYLGFTKQLMRGLQELFERFKDRKSIYLEGVFERLIECYGISMKAKYECPSAGPKEAMPLWKVAGVACMEIIKRGLDSMKSFGTSEVPIEVINSTYERICDVMDGFLLPKVAPPASLSVDDIEGDEKFDISVLKIIESHIILHMAQAHVDSKFVLKLVDTIRRGSRLYLSISEAKGNEMVANDISPVESPTKYGLGSDVIPIVKEKLAAACLEMLFSFCASTEAAPVAERHRIAELVCPVLLERCETTIRNYAADKPLLGKMPLPWERNDEILFILSQLNSLKLRPEIVKIDITDMKLGQLQKHIISGTSAHLFLLYPAFVDCLGIGFDATDEQVVEILKSCMKRIGKDLGLAM